MTPIKAMKKVGRKSGKLVRFATALSFCMVQVFSYSGPSLAAEVTADPNASAQTPIIVYNPDAVPSAPPASSNGHQSHQSTDEPNPLSAVEITTLSSVPAGWTQTQSNSNYAFQRTFDSFGNVTATLMDLRTNKQYVVGFGSGTTHNPFKVDVAPDESTVLVAFHESGPVVGSLSWVELHHFQDIESDPIGGYKNPESILSGVYQSHQFANGNATVSVLVYNTDTSDPYDTKVKVESFSTIVYSLITPSGNKRLSYYKYDWNSNDTIKIEDLRTGEIHYEGLSSYGFGGIKAVNPSETYAIVGGNVNTFYIVPIADFNQSSKLIFVPMSFGASPDDYGVEKAVFVSNSTANLTLKNGVQYILNIQTGALTPGAARPPRPPHRHRRR